MSTTVSVPVPELPLYDAADLESRLPKSLITLDGEARYERTLKLRGGPLHIYRVYASNGSYVYSLEHVRRLHEDYLRDTED